MEEEKKERRKEGRQAGMEDRKKEKERGRKEKTAASIQTFHLCGWAGHHGEQVQRFFAP